MKTNNTPLFEIMSLLDISTKELATRLNIERTSISKWRSGSRQLKANTLYINELVNFFVNVDMIRKNYTLENYFINDIGVSKEVFNKEGIKFVLKQYLTSKQSNENHDDYKIISEIAKYTTQVSCFDGGNGRIEATFGLLELLRMENESKILKIIDGSKFLWLVDNRENTIRYVDTIHQLLDQGHQVHVIWILSDMEIQYSLMLSLSRGEFFHKNFYSYYYILDSKHQDLNGSLFLVENEYMLLGSNGAEFKDYFTGFYSDRLSLTCYNNKFEVWRNLAYRLFSDSIVEAIELLGNRIGYDEDAYYASKELPIAYLSEELLNRVIRVNNLDNSQSDLLRSFWLYTRGVIGIDGNNKKCIQIIYEKYVRKQMNQKLYKHNLLTCLIGKEILLDHSTMNCILSAMIQTLDNNPNMKVLFEYEEKHLIDSTHIICKKNSYFIAFSSLNNNVKYSGEAIAANVLFNTFSSDKKAFTPDLTNSEYIINRLIDLRQEKS